MKNSEKLLARLRQEGIDLPPCTELRRTHRNRKTPIGAFSWFAYCPLAIHHPEHFRHMNLRYGSHWAMHVLLRADGFTCQELQGDICIDPVFKDES